MNVTWQYDVICANATKTRLNEVGTDDVIVDTDEDSMLSSEVPGKQKPLVHSDTILLSRSCSLVMH